MMDTVVIIIVALAVGFAIGAAWMWRLVNQAFDEYEQEQ